MSWSITAIISQEDCDIDILKADALKQNPECGDQFDVAFLAVKSFMESEVVGGAGKQFYISMAGHANPNHEPREGFANDMLTISINQRTED